MDNQSNSGRPQLKKIKRPINRTIPISDTISQNSLGNNPFSSASSGAKSVPTTEIDSYLDSPVSASTSGKEIGAPSFQNEQNIPQYIEEDEYNREVYGQDSSSGVPDWLNTKVFFLIVIVSLFVGVVAGKFIFAESKVVRNGLQGVVVNNEVPRGRARCGVAERGQGCVLYLMNPQRQEMTAKDFYDLASQMTGRQRFMIETGNMRYANTRIRPGDIAQLNIPPL